MDLVVVRHGIAVDREDAATSQMTDRDRPLTVRGRKRMKKGARGLARRAPDLASLYSSPYLRAVETAELIEDAYPGLEHVETKALLPEADPEELAHLLAEAGVDSPACVVGHEPHLSSFVSYCLTGSARPIVVLEKGGACLLRFSDAPGAALGRLVWLSQASSLRKGR